MTVREALAAASRALGSSGCADPGIDSELLLMHILGLPRHSLHMSSRITLDPVREEEYFALVAARAGRIPLQHLTGEAWFMGRRFLSGPEALVPRQDTEATLEVLLGMLDGDPSRLLDAGTGSGVIAITLALEYPGCLVVGSDVSPDALGLAARNRALHGAWNAALVRCDLGGALAGGFDGIAANLPYIPSGVIPTLEPEVGIHDPAVSLDGGPDGMTLIRTFSREAVRLLRPGGALVMEASGPQPSILAALLESTGEWSDVGHGADLSGRPRWVAARRT